MTVPDRVRTEMILSGELLDVGTEWVESGGLRFRKQIVTTTETVQVTVRREELVVDVRHIVETSADGLTWAGTSYEGPPTAPPIAQPPHVFLLREEVPDVRVVTRVYERATIRSVLVSNEVPVHAVVRREQAVVGTAEGYLPPEPTNSAFVADPVQLLPDTGVEPDWERRTRPRTPPPLATNDSYAIRPGEHA